MTKQRKANSARIVFVSRRTEKSRRTRFCCCSVEFSSSVVAAQQQPARREQQIDFSFGCSFVFFAGIWARQSVGLICARHLVRRPDENQLVALGVAAAAAAASANDTNEAERANEI